MDLPSVGAYSYLYLPVPILVGGYDPRTGQLKNVFPGGSTGIPAGERTEDFYPPNQPSYTEVIQHIVPALSNRQTAYMNPSADSANDADYAWHSNTIDGLEPTFEAIDLNAADSHTQAAFYAGIAFGVAGSAVIALIQEIPAERKRKSSTSGAQNRQTEPLPVPGWHHGAALAGAHRRGLGNAVRHELHGPLRAHHRTHCP